MNRPTMNGLRRAAQLLGATALGALAACTPSTTTPPARPAPLTPSVAPAVLPCPETPPALPEDGAEVDGPPLGLTIARICLHGAGPDTRSAAGEAITLRDGQKLSPEATRASVEKLLGTRLFEDVRLGAEVHEGAAIVHVVLQERPRIEEVVVEPESAKNDFPMLVLGQRADAPALRGLVERLEDQLHQQGKGNAKIAMALEPTGKGGARVRVKVDLGPTWTIASTSFPGAKKVPEADLRGATQIAAGSTWNEQVIERATLLLTSLYYDRGFVTARVAEPEQSVDSKGAVSLSWKVEEGEPYTIRKITFAGKLTEKKEGELSALLKSRPRMTFSRSLMASDVERIRDFFAKRGQKVEVTPQVELDPKQKVISIGLEITPSAGGPGG